jgi:DNA-binding CsgD family transcriptional regulator
MEATSLAPPHEMYSCWGIFDGRVRFTVDRRRNLVTKCKLADAAFRRGNDLVLRDGRVEMVDPLKTEEFSRMVSDVSDSVLRMIAPRQDRDGELIVSVRSTQDRDIVAVVGQGTGSDFSIEFVDLRVAFPLTRCEALVAAHLLECKSTEEVARSMGTSVATVRCHMKHIYEKLGIQSREQLFKVAAPYRLR